MKLQAPMLRGSSCNQTSSPQIAVTRARVERIARVLEWSQLLDPDNRYRIGLLPQGTRIADQQRPCRCRAPRGSPDRGGQPPRGHPGPGMKVPARKLGQVGRRERIAQEALRRHQDQRAWIVIQPQGLPPQQVEILGGRRGSWRPGCCPGPESCRKRSRRALECSGPCPS